MKVTHVTSDDWTGLYLNNELVWETHTLPGWVVLEALAKAGVIELETLDADDEWIEENGLPNPLSYIKTAREL